MKLILFSQWTNQVDPTSEFNKRQVIQQRTSIGPLDCLVEHHAAEHGLDVRVFKAEVCRVIMGQLRGGLSSLANAMKAWAKENWKDKEFKKAHSSFLKRSTQWLKVKACMQAVRKHLRNPKDRALPSDEDDPLLKFVIKALLNASDCGWQTGTDQTYQDGKNSSRLIERFVTTSFDNEGAAYTWLVDPAVWVPLRQTFGGLFSQNGPYDFADGMTERANIPYVSIADTVTALGAASLANCHVLWGKSLTLGEKLTNMITKIRDLIDEAAGIPGAGGATVLPGLVYAHSRLLLEVSLAFTLSALFSLAHARLRFSLSQRLRRRRSPTRSNRPRATPTGSRRPRRRRRPPTSLVSRFTSTPRAMKRRTRKRSEPRWTMTPSTPRPSRPPRKPR